MKIVIFNLGCKVNQYECEVLCEKLKEQGYCISDHLEYADIYILNTCAVTSEAERKSRQAISRCKTYNPNAKIIVCGCASQNAPNSFKKEGVIYITGTADKISIINHITDDNININIAEFPKEYEETELNITNRTRAFIKIQDGCNNFCSYCLIPYLRGRSRSRKLENVLSEVNRLSLVTKEIVLTGIDLMSYGKDIGTNLKCLIDNLKKVDVRIRLGSIYAEKITEELLDSLFSLRNFCPHFHLSLQSGDNSILKSMNRHYTTDEYLQKINLIRRYDNNVSITTDLIVGYPTETDENFKTSCDFLKEANFSDLHIFPFSARTGTRAALLPKISSEIVMNRKKILNEIKINLKKKFLVNNLNTVHEILFEEIKDGYSVGYSKNYIKIYTQKQGSLINTIPTKIYKDGLMEE